jgi:hypothetical protein
MNVNVALAEVTYDAAVTAENVNVISFEAAIELAQVAAPVHEPEAVTGTPAKAVISAAASTADVAGHAEGRTETVRLSEVAALVVTVTGTVIVEICPTTAVFAVAVPRAQVVGAAAFEGTDDKRPKPRDATATSATRLKVVFVDICFLSISRVREFPELGFG